MASGKSKSQENPDGIRRTNNGGENKKSLAHTHHPHTGEFGMHFGTVYGKSFESSRRSRTSHYERRLKSAQRNHENLTGKKSK